MPGKRRTPLPYPNGQDPIEVHIGLRRRQLRYQRGLTQSQIGAALGITFQQVQKFEHGRNRISVATLYRAAKALDVPINVFFDGFGDAVSPQPNVDRDGEPLSAAVSRIRDPLVQKALQGVVMALVDDGRKRD